VSDILAPRRAEQDLTLTLVASILVPGSGVAQAQHLYPAEWSEAVAFCGDDACKDLV
jgi:hypothetical protein